MITIDMFKSLFTSLLLLIAFSGSASACDYPDQGTLIEMIERADVVFAGVVGKVVNEDSKGGIQKNVIDGIVRKTESRWNPYLAIEIKPLKQFKGYVENPVKVIHNVQCTGNYWLGDVGKIRVIIGDYAGSHIQAFLGIGHYTQKEFIDYLEKGIEPEPDCSHDIEKDVKSSFAEVQCNRTPQDIDNPFRFIPPMPPAQ